MFRATRHLHRPARVASACGLAVALAVAVAGAAGAEPGFGSTKAMPSPADSTRPPVAPFGAISCPSATSCTAAGPYSSNVGQGSPSVVTQTAGIWGTPKAITLPVGGVAGTSEPASLTGISCSDAADCTAVGIYPTSGAKSRLPMVATETAGIWGAATTFTLPAGYANVATLAILTSVWCASAGNCLAVGFYYASDQKTHPFAIEQTAGTWGTATVLPEPAGVGTLDSFSILETFGLSCADLADCTIVGTIDDPFATTKAFSEIETGGTWGATPDVITAGTARLTALLDVSCPTQSTCVAVGEQSDSASLFATPSPLVIAKSTVTTWGAAKKLGAPNLSPATNGGALDSVSCASTTTCEAVGNLEVASTGYAVAYADTDTAGTWSNGSILTSPPAGVGVGNDNFFQAVACTSTTSCTAVGGAGVLNQSIGNGPEPVYSFSSVLTPVAPVSMPGAPVGVVAQAYPTSARVTWGAPYADGGAPVSGFTVTAYPSGKTCSTTGTHSCAMHGLVNGDHYRFRVVDRTSFGSSHPSAASGPILVGASPSIPRHVKAVGSKHASALVTWDKSTSATHEAIRDYVVTLVPVRSPGRTRVCVTRKLQCQVGGLRPHVTYRVTVVATDASGSSKSSAVIEVVST